MNLHFFYVCYYYLTLKFPDMKKLYFLTLMLLGSFVANAQFALTSATHGLVTGNTVSYHPIIPTPSPGTGGSNMTWDFAADSADLTTNFTETYVAATAKQQQTYAGTNITMYTSDGDTTFFRQTTGASVDSTIITGIDYLGGQAQFAFNDADLIMKYPFDYNTIAFTDVVSGPDVSGSSTTDIDGYGVVKLKSGVYAAVRSKYVLSLNIVVSVMPPVSIPASITDYTWFMSGIKNPLMKSRKITINAFGINDSAMYINTLYTGIKNNVSINSNITVYPNPAKEVSKLTVTTEKAGDVSVEIYSNSGSLVYTEQLGNLGTGAHTYDLNMSNVASGIYMIRVVTADGVGTQKLIKE
jgi:hypothetical protein